MAHVVPRLHSRSHDPEPHEGPVRQCEHLCWRLGVVRPFTNLRPCILEALLPFLAQDFVATRLERTGKAATDPGQQRRRERGSGAALRVQRVRRKARGVRRVVRDRKRLGERG